MQIDQGFLLAESLRRLPYTPTRAQLEVLTALSSFAATHRNREVFVLNGYAGTGKTSLVGALIAAMSSVRMKTTVLAPTGRAAKVAGKYSARMASTVHRHIYRPTQTEGGTTGYALGRNTARDTLYIVDEASMVTDRAPRSMLADLTQFVYSAPGCAMVLVGDVAQLPPVGQDDACAMDEAVLRRHVLRPQIYTLTEPVRQAAESGILVNATEVRRHIGDGNMSLPRLQASGFSDVDVVDFYDFADRLATSWSEVGKEETVIITRANWRANDINTAVRNQVLWADEPLQRGERLVVAKNNYFWTRGVKGIPFLANGETVTIDWIGRVHRAYGLEFADVELHLPGHDEIVAAKMMLSSLTAKGPALPQSEMSEFYRRVFESKEGSPTERMMAATEDEYYNALQVKYAYCVTCHKAQGGQWKHVYIDLSGLVLDAIDETFFRWLYTALTRASQRVFFVNPSIPVE